jgi:hypothetical protein
MNALAAMTGPSVARKPTVDANPTRAATDGPTMIAIIEGTCDAAVTESLEYRSEVEFL